MHDHQPYRFPDTGSLLKNVNPPCCSEVGSHRDERCTHQPNASHPSTTVSNTVDALDDGVAKTPCTASRYTEVPLSGSRSHCIDDQSQYISSCHSQTTTSWLVSESYYSSATSHRPPSNFYSTSSHYSMKSRLTVPAPAAVDCRHVPSTPSAVTTVALHSVTAVQQKQNIIQMSKPFESSDVLRYSEKLRHQRLNDSAVAPAELL